MKKIIEKIKNFIINNYVGLIIILFIYLLFTIDLPYVVYKPGGTVNLNNRIMIDNDNIKGKLSMSYVSMLKGTLPILGLSYILPNWDIISKDEITIDNGSVDDLLTLEKLYMDSSIDNATILAYKAAGKPIEITKVNNNVIYITKEAKTDIKLYDKIISIEGTMVNTLDEIRDIIANYKVNDTVDILVERKNKEITVKAKIYEIEDSLKIGVSTLSTYEYETTPEIKVKTKASESGSSGGLMLSLAIYNKLTKEDITKGKNIVGTGTIDILGNVGAIDGVKYKLLGAVKNKADIFLCPIENYDEALEVKENNNLDIIVKGVETFNDALDYLTTIK